MCGMMKSRTGAIIRPGDSFEVQTPSGPKRVRWSKSPHARMESLPTAWRNKLEFVYFPISQFWEKDTVSKRHLPYREENGVWIHGPESFSMNVVVGIVTTPTWYVWRGEAVVITVPSKGGIEKYHSRMPVIVNDSRTKGAKWEDLKKILLSGNPRKL